MKPSLYFIRSANELNADGLPTVNGMRVHNELLTLRNCVRTLVWIAPPKPAVARPPLATSPIRSKLALNVACAPGAAKNSIDAPPPRSKYTSRT